MPDHVNAELRRFLDYLETLTRVQIDPRLRAKLGHSDLVAQTLAEAHKSIEVLRTLDEKGQKRYLRRMLMNNLLEAVEKFKSQARDCRREVSLDEAAHSSACRLRDALAVEDSPPDARLMREELGLSLAEALTQLPPPQRQAIILQRYHGWTLRQIADEMGCTVGAVAGLQARGLRALRELLPDWEATSDA